MTADEFEELVHYGFQPHPLRPSTKIPMFTGWTNWDRSRCLHYIMHYPNCNVGIVLGDIMDVEGDSAEANHVINRLTEGYPHPCYRSRKSTHHLFQSPDTAITKIVFQDIEFRGSCHQSAIPPSLMDDGTRYEWITRPDGPPPPMPDKLLAFLRKIITKRRGDIKPGHTKVTCIVCGEKNYMHAKRFNLEIRAFKSLNQRWSCRKCRQTDLRPLCRMLRHENNKMGNHVF